MSILSNWTQNVTFSQVTTTQIVWTTEVIQQSDSVLMVVTVVLVVNVAVSLFLNIFLVLIILYSPSLRTPPNSHLLNICINNLLLCMDMGVCLFSIHFNGMTLTDGQVRFFSGVQLFLTYNSLLQYWGTFASIGYYRQLVTRSVAFNWVISSLLSLMVTLAYASSSRYALTTLDPFRRDFYNSRNYNSSTKEHVAVTLIILLAFSAGLGVILTAYYSICRTLNVVSVVGKNRVSPHIHADSSDLTMSAARPYRTQYSISAPTYIGGVLSSEHRETFIVTFSKQDSSVVTEDPVSGETRPQRMVTNSARKPEDSPEKRALSSTLSSASNASVRAKTTEFTDLSVGADLLRFQKQQSQILQRRQSFRRETISLSSAIKNSLAMLLAYCACSLPLIAFTVPDAGLGLTGPQRIAALLSCRLLFYVNAMAYPLWYLLFSATVRKCFARLWEGVVGRYRFR